VYPRSYAQYTLLERLATGGMSEVDLARRAVEDAGFVRFVVIKRIRANHVEDEAFVRMFKDEARITSELRHTNIAQVYDFGRVKDEYYLALEYVPGTDVRALLTRLRHRRQRMPVRIALRIVHDTLSALHYAHTRTDQLGRPMNVVHRDVNPRNLMINLDGTVKLIDFGVARATDRLERTRSDHFKGKVAYMAPEQVKGKDLDHRVDVFAVGLTLYELLTGTGAFAGLDQTQILYRLMHGRLPTLDVPREWGAAGRELQAVVHQAIAVEPDQRYADAEVMRRAVAAVAASFGGLPEPTEVATWLHEQDEELEGRVRNKMRAWADLAVHPVDPSSLSTIPDVALPDDPSPLERSGTLDRPTLGGTQTLRRPAVWLAVGAGGIAAIVGGGLLVVLVVAVAVFWAWPKTVLPEQVVIEAGPGPRTEASPPVVPEALPNADLPRKKLQLGVVRPADTGSPPPSSGAELGRGPRIVPPVPDVAPSAPAVEPSRLDPVGSGGPLDLEPQTPPPVVPPAGAASGPAGPPAPVPPPTSVAGTADPPKPEAEARISATAPGVVGISCSERGLPVTVNGQATNFRTGEQVKLPEGTHQIGVPGYPAQTVTVRSGMFTSVKFTKAP
jgi:serine/threonine protein kinase